MKWRLSSLQAAGQMAAGQTHPSRHGALPVLSLQLAPGWRADPDVSSAEEHVYRAPAGLAQLSTAYAGMWHSADPLLDGALVHLARACGMGLEQARTLTTERGRCALGRFGTATFCADDAPFAQAWYLTDGQELIRALYITAAAPTLDDMVAVHQMVSSLQIHWHDGRA